METVNINTEKVREAIAPALAYQPKVEPKIISEENNPLVIIALPGIQALDLKALESASTALCGFLGHRGQVGLVNGQLCLSFWKDDLQKEFHENA